MVALGKALKCSSGRQRGDIEGFEGRITLLRSAPNLQRYPGLAGRESEGKPRESPDAVVEVQVSGQVRVGTTVLWDKGGRAKCVFEVSSLGHWENGVALPHRMHT